MNNLNAPADFIGKWIEFDGKKYFLIEDCIAGDVFPVSVKTATMKGKMISFTGDKAPDGLYCDCTYTHGIAKLLDES